MIMAENYKDYHLGIFVYYAENLTEAVMKFLGIFFTLKNSRT
jgi:hypothetical protein